MNTIEELYKQWQSLQPLKKEDQKRLDNKFRLEFNYNSNHLEGNTLTYGQTKLLLIFGETEGRHDLREFEEMKAHDVALRLIKEEATDKERPLTETFIRELNRIILVEPFRKEMKTPNGQRTMGEVKIGDYKSRPNSVETKTGEIFEYASPEETPAMMTDLVNWYNVEAAKRELSPIELASVLHYRYIRIHPFEDGNGRIARLLVNFVLHRFGYPMVIVKSKEKEDYLHVLRDCDIVVGLTPSDGANASLERINPFVNYMSELLIQALEISIRAAKGESIEEQDDWEKQLSLLKKELGDKGEKAITKSKESFINVLQNSFIPLAEVFDKKLSQFDSLFIYHKNQIFYSSTYAERENIKGIVEALIGLDSIYPEYIIQKSFNNFRHPYIVARINSIMINAAFKDDVYIVKCSSVQYIKQYNQFLSEEEINTIVSAIAKDLLQQIENLKK